MSKFKHYWTITYTDVRTGERKTYMNNVGFDLFEVQRELGRIRRERTRLRKLYPDLMERVREMQEAGMYVPSYMVGRDWRRKRITVRIKTP